MNSHLLLHRTRNFQYDGFKLWGCVIPRCRRIPVAKAKSISWVNKNFQVLCVVACRSLRIWNNPTTFKLINVRDFCKYVTLIHTGPWNEKCWVPQRVSKWCRLLDCRYDRTPLKALRRNRILGHSQENPFQGFGAGNNSKPVNNKMLRTHSKCTQVDLVNF